MLVINKYIRKSLLKAFLVFTFLFFVLSIFIQIFGQIRYLGRGGYDIYQLLLYALLLQPRNIYQFFPIISLISLSFVMGRLMLRKELVAIAAMGAGVFNIIYITFITMLQIVILSVLVGEGLAPYSTTIAKEMRLSALHNGKLVAVKGQIWLKENDWFINIGSITDDNVLHNITRYKLDNSSNLTRIEFAERAVRKDSNWYLEDISWTEIRQNESKSGFNKSSIWDSNLDEKLIESYDSSAMKQPLWILLHRLIHGINIGGGDDYYSLVFWQRILQPLLSLIMIFIAVIIFFDFDRHSSYNAAMCKAIALGFTFYILRDPISTSMFALGLYPLFAAIIPLVFGIIIFLYLLQKYLGGNIIKRFIERND